MMKMKKLITIKFAKATRFKTIFRKQQKLLKTAYKLVKKLTKKYIKKKKNLNHLKIGKLSNKIRKNFFN